MAFWRRKSNSFIYNINEVMIQTHRCLFFLSMSNQAVVRGKGINIKIYTKRNSVKIVLSEEVLYVASRFAAGTLSFELNHTDTSKPVFQSQLLVHL